MDRIQKALEKAKAKHAEVGSFSLPKVEGSSEILTFDNIAYAQTKIDPVSREVLEKNRVIAGFYNNPQSAVFRMLRTQVLQKMRFLRILPVRWVDVKMISK